MSANRFRATRYANDQSTQPSLDHDKTREPNGPDAPTSPERVCEPYEVVFQTKPQLAASLTEKASVWELPAAPILADCAYGDDTAFRTRLHTLEREYVLAVSAQISVYGPETTFAVPERHGPTGRPRSVARPDRRPESVRALAERLPKRAWETIPCRTTPAGEEISSRFAFVRVVATHPVRTDCLPPRWEWLIIEWPEGEQTPRFRDRLVALGLDTGASSTQIVPVVVGTSDAALALGRSVEDGGVLAVAIRPPTVPAGAARLRFSLTAVHSDGELDLAVVAIEQALPSPTTTK